MSETENLKTSRTNFASRLLNKELTDRTKKTTLQFSKMTPADAAKFATEEKVETKETVAAGK